MICSYHEMRNSCWRKPLIWATTDIRISICQSGSTNRLIRNNKFAKGTCPLAYVLVLFKGSVYENVIIGSCDCCITVRLCTYRFCSTGKWSHSVCRVWDCIMYRKVFWSTRYTIVLPSAIADAARGLVYKSASSPNDLPVSACPTTLPETSNRTFLMSFLERYGTFKWSRRAMV